MMSDFDRIGREDGLTRFTEAFVARCRTDMMIGYLFQRVDPARLARLEYEHAAAHLGVGTYTGKPLRAAHAHLTLASAQFDRRLRLLEETGRALGVPDDVVAGLVAYQASLRSLVLGRDDGRCGAPHGD